MHLKKLLTTAGIALFAVAAGRLPTGAGAGCPCTGSAR